jgi:putative chitinase
LIKHLPGVLIIKFISPRFGFNGQEKDNEVSGDGNSYTAEFWQYDPRLGRRFNVDPVMKVWESPYATFANNPIYYGDPSGADPTPSGLPIQKMEPWAPGKESGSATNPINSNFILNEVVFTASKPIESGANPIIKDGVMRQIAPNTNIHRLNEIKATINKYGSQFGLNNPNALNHFLAQASHESANFTRMEENLNYSAAGLEKTFPKYFGIFEEDADDYAHNRQKIANYVYGNGKNGNTTYGDGYKFRGAGLIQLTGKENYQRFNRYLSRQMPTLQVTGASDIVNSVEMSTISAMWYFQTRVLIKVDINTATVTEVSKLVNGGRIGLTDRIKRYQKIKKINN